VFVSGIYVALGDSMSIDDYAGGPGRGAASLLHRNLNSDFPDWAGRDLATVLAVQVLARDGAVAADVLQRQLPLVTQAPALVTLTMGGNDVMGAYGDSHAARVAIGRVMAVGEAIMVQLRALCGAAVPIVVTTVYDPSDGTGEVAGSGLPPWLDGPDLVHELNAALVDLAERHGALVADVHSCFRGHGVTAGDPATADPRPADRNLWYCGVIEPNAWGAHEIRAAWWQALANRGWRPTRV
jgi:lysophospholipase L1-like esterase